MKDKQFDPVCPLLFSPHAHSDLSVLIAVVKQYPADTEHQFVNEHASLTGEDLLWSKPYEKVPN